MPTYAVELQNLQQQLRDVLAKAGRLKQGSEFELDQVKKEIGTTHQELKDEQVQVETVFIHP